MSHPSKSDPAPNPQKKHRVVVECDPALYRGFRAKLVKQGVTVRAWFEMKMRQEK